MCRILETSRKQVSFILALEVGQIDQGSTSGAALCNTSFGQNESGIRWTNRNSIVHDWLYLPCPRGASRPVSLTCATDWHFLSHPPVLACALASSQHSKFISVRLVRRLLQTKGASSSRITSSTIRIRFGVFRTMPKHMLTQNWQKLHVTGPQLKATSSLPLEDLCIFFWGRYCNVNFGMVEFAALTVWLHWMRCQSFRTSLDQMTGSHCNSPGKYGRNRGYPKDSWYSIGYSWRKEFCQSMERHTANVCKNGCYRLASLWFWCDATSAWWTFKTSWKYFTFMFAWGAQIDPESTAGHAICDNSFGHHQNCLHSMRKLPCDHLFARHTCNYVTIQFCIDPPGASPYVSWLWLVPCVGFLASRQQKKSISRFDLDQWNIFGLPV